MNIPLDDPPLSGLRRLRVHLRSSFSERSQQRLLLSALPEELAIIVKHAVMTKDRRLFYVKNSKAACTTVTQLMHRYVQGQTFPGHVHVSPHLLQGTNSLSDILSGLVRPDTFRFTTVRDPLHRAVSAFFDFFVDRANAAASRHFHNMGVLGFSSDKSLSYNFDVFLDYLERNFEMNAKHCDRHWRYQTTNIALGQVSYGLIMRVEALADGLAELLDKTGIDLQKCARVRHNQSSASQHPEFQLSESQRLKVRALYEIDYANFGY